jgi:hypothetical protein
MVTPYYVGVDVPSVDSVQQMTYYIHHNKMAAAHYECTDVFSVDPSDQMMYYTPYSNKAGPHRVQVGHSESSAK